MTLNAVVRKQAPTVPLPAPKYWQSRHQHTRVVIGGSALSQRTAPQRHLPVTVIGISKVETESLLRRGSYAWLLAQVQRGRLSVRWSGRRSAVLVPAGAIAAPLNLIVRRHEIGLMSEVVKQIRPEEVEITAVRAQGAGGQNVNKVSSAVHLRFDIQASSLADELKQRLLSHPDGRITCEGVIIIKAQRYRTLEKNRDDALARLQEIVDKVATPRLPRKRTRPTKSSQRRRVDEKVSRGKIKATRRRPDLD